MPKKHNCIFCNIVRGKVKSYVIMENELSLAFLDINPLAEGHCLVVPKRHVPWWHNLTEEEICSIFKLARATARKLMKIYKPDFVAMYIRGRRVPHTHVFLIPTYKGDSTDRLFNTLEGFQESAVKLASLKKPAVLRKTANGIMKIK
jgi:histidine triad (HIT) family protein